MLYPLTLLISFHNLSRDFCIYSTRCSTWTFMLTANRRAVLLFSYLDDLLFCHHLLSKNPSTILHWSVLNWVLKVDTLLISRVLCAILSSQDLYPGNSSHFDLLTLSASYPQLRGTYQGPSWFPHLVLWPKASPKRASWGNYRPCLYFFPISQESLSFTAKRTMSWKSHHMFYTFFGCFRQVCNPFLVTSYWLEVEVLIS